MTEPTAEERERMIDILSTDSLWETSHGFEVVADALIAAGFGDLSSERERADKELDEVTDRWERMHYEACIGEHQQRQRADRLQARIDAALAAVSRYAQGPDEDSDYWIEPEDGYRLLRDVRVALTEDKPAAAPETSGLDVLMPPETLGERIKADGAMFMAGVNSWSDVPPRGTCTRPPAGWWCSLDEGHEGPCPAQPELTMCAACRNGQHGACYGPNEFWGDCGCACQATPEPNDGPGSDGNHTETGECFACLVGVATGPESHGNGCIFATPEPPHLDPSPVICGLGVSQRHGFTHAPYWCGGEFAPREHDENGKPYSRKREDYGV